MAWTTQQAIEALGNAAGNTQPIERVLKILGFIGDVQGLRYVLETAVELAPQFLALRAALPGLEEHIDCYLSAGALLQQLSETPYFSDHHDAALSGSKRFPAGSNHEMPSGPIGNLLKEYEKSECHGTNSGRGFLSILWLIQSMRYLSAAPKVNRCLHLATRHPRSYSYYCMISDAIRMDFASELPVLADGLASVDLWAWLRAFNVKFLKNNYGLGKTSPFRLLGFALARLNKEKPPLPANQHLAPPAPRALRLEERYLAIGHWGFPRPHELVSLQDFLRHKSDNGSDDPLFFEKLIVALAAATARTVEEVLHLHVDGSVNNWNNPNYAVQKLAFVPVPNFHGGTSRRAVWIIPSNRGTTAIVLPLPARVGLALHSWVKPDMRGKIIDLLPPSSTEWLDRIEDIVAKTLGCTKPRANRILRDSLLRLAYDKSANRAVVALLASNRIQLPKLERSEQLALSHYLDPLGARTFETYKEACREIFHKFGSGNEVATTNCHAHGDHAVKLVAHQAVSEAMRSRVVALSDGNNPVALHNAYARYCLTLLIVATGHRRSRSPFFFPWDLHVNDRLAFICDKAVVGSEARFVPLAETTTNQIRAYFRHLLALRDRRGVVGPLVREHIDKLVRAPSENHEAVLSQSSGRPLEAGLFFLIRENGSIETIGTGNLDAQFVENGFSVKVHKFRAALADALWGKGLSGIEVATLLGHSNELHPFGPASVWSVGDWAERIRPLIQAYLDERGWLAIESPLVKPRLVGKEFHPAMPRLSPDNLAYEGRSRERKLATICARKAVRAVLSEDVLSDPKQKIDDDCLGEIRARIAQILWSDDAAKLRVLNVLEKEFDALRARGTTISAAAINLIRTDPSPVEISFGRHLALASAFRQQWINRVGETIGGALDTVERAAQLAISMVVLDGLLDSERVKQITLSAITGEVTPYFDALVLRATVKTPRFEFDYSLLPGAISSALTLGLQKSLNAEGGSRPSEWREIERRVSDILIKTFGRNTGRGGWKVADLCGLFRPWWFIRLPGAVYSIAIGDYNGPAPHPISEASLLATVEPIAVEPFLRLPKFDGPGEGQTNNEQAEALSLFRSILNKAAGVLEHGTSRTRIQRAKLYRLLTAELDPRLAFWMREQAIIDALVGFIFRLLEQGGPREADLTFSSIDTYIDRIAKVLVAEAWDADMQEMSVEDYEALYERVALSRKDKRVNWRLALRLFHQHLRESIDAPYISSVSRGKPVRQRCRSSLLTLETIKMAWSHLATAGYVPSAFQGPSKAMLVLGIGYGLRATEAIGLASDDFDKKENSLLSVQKNAIRDLKSSASRRVIPISILSAHYIRQLTIQRNLAKDAPGPDRYLFGAPSRDEKILRRDAIVGWIKASLRAASANGYVVFHDLRHSFATALTLAALPECSGYPVVQRAYDRLVDSTLHDESVLRKLMRMPTGSPFLVDGIARILGHESVDTLHDVYAHGTFMVLADHARFANLGITIEDGRLAGMLGRSRTAIPKVRKTLMSRGKDGKMVTLVDLTCHYINLYVRERAGRGPARQSSCADLPPKWQASSTRTGQASWVQLDRLLCVRKRNLIPLEILRTQAQEEYGLSEHAANQLIERYRSLVLDVGFDDFEPDESDLIKGRPARGDGVLRGQKEREASLAEVEKKYHALASFRRALQQVCQSWLERVEPEDPWLVCKTQEEFDSLLLVLDELGASANQIEFEGVGSVLDPVISYVLRKSPGAKIHSSGRFSRGPKKARLVEVGARIRQAAGSRIGDGRDFHRLMLILTIGLGADEMTPLQDHSGRGKYQGMVSSAY